MHKEKEITHNTDQEPLKEGIIRQLEALENPLVFRRIKAVLDEKETLDRIQHIPAIQELITEEENEDYQIRKHQKINKNSALSRYDARAAQPMFYLGILSLVLIGGLITTITEDELSPTFLALLPWFGGLSSLVYFLFALDLGLLFYQRGKGEERMNPTEKKYRLFTLLFPPLRIGSRNIVSGEYIWTPFWHWCKANEGLFVELKKSFVIPMISIALLIVPVLIIEWKFLDEIKAEMPGLKIDLFLDSVQTFIWCAFTFEFILMISISNRKLHYIKKNWIDLLIILLPFVSFLRTLRISQIARLKYATRSFKLRGVVTKARQGLIFVDFLQRIFRLRPETELKRLYRLLRENQRDREALQEKLREVSELMERKKQKKKSRTS